MNAEKLNDKWFRFVGIPLIGLMGHIIFFNRNNTGPERFGFLTIYFLSVLETFVLWEANRVVVIYYRKKYRGLAQTPNRVIHTLIVCIFITIILRTGNVYLYDKSFFWGYRFPVEAYLHSIFVALLFVLVIAGVYEGIYYFIMWKNTAVEAEALRAENLQTELDLLKMQLDPHFLFNTLGSLSSLIDEDTARAKTFLEQMSMVYRYLLQSHDKSLVTLREEIAFLRSYIQLLKTRFGAGLEISIADSIFNYIEFYLPPLTIQLLVENAVKHNIATVLKPLKIEIFISSEGNLMVKNNLNKKSSAVISHKKGLANILAKYNYMKQPGLSIEEQDGSFIVTVPLIKK